MKKNDKEDPIHSAIRHENETELDELIVKGNSVNNIDIDGRTPIFYASLNGKMALVLKLINANADVNAKDNEGRTPLHFAVQGYQPEIIKLLIKHAADIHAQDTYGNTPLHRAVFESRGKGDAILELLNAGADKNIKNKHGVSPKDLANKIANFSVSEFLN